MAAKRVFCFAVTASICCLTAAGGYEDEDAEMLVQARVSRDTEEAACQCLSWKDVFTSGNYHTRCGDGPAELAWAHNWDELPGNRHYKDDVCKFFLHKFAPSACINFKYGTKSMDQWCFVDKSCSKATPIDVNPVSKVGYKMCKAGEDTLLREQSPMRIWELANESHVDPAMLIKWAYPISGALEGNVKWTGVKEAMGLVDTHETDLYESTRLIKLLKKSKRSMVFESDEKYHGQPPFGFISGNTTWEVTRTPFLGANAINARNSLAVQLHTDMVSRFHCIQGCS